MKKIIWIHSHLDYWMGGTKYIYEVMRRLSKSFEVTLVVDSASSLAREYYNKLNINLIVLNLPSSNKLIYWLTLPMQINMRIARIKKYARRDDIIISSMFPSNVIAARLTTYNYQLCFEPFAFFHDKEFISGFGTVKKIFISILRALYSKMDIEYTRKSKTVFTLNEVTSRGIQRVYRRTSKIIYAGIDSRHFYRHVNRSLKTKWKGKLIIIHSTDYSPVKRTDSMIKIFAKVAKKVGNTHLIITSTINNSAEISKLKKLARDLGIKKRVHFMGFLPYDLIPQYYSLAKVLVQTSYSELSGTTSMALPVKEALACETWCIRSPVTKEDVVNGVNGYLVDPRDDKKMIEKIITILDTPLAKYRSGGRQGRKKIVSVYNWKSVVQKITDQLEFKQ